MSQRARRLAESGMLPALQKVVDEVLDVTRASRVTLRLEEVDFAVVAEAVLPSVRALTAEPPPTDVRADPVARRVFDNQEIVVVDRVHTDEVAPNDPRSAYRIKAEIVAPIVRDGRCVGALSVHDVTRWRRWTATQRLAVCAATKEVGHLMTPSTSDPRVRP